MVRRKQWDARTNTNPRQHWAFIIYFYSFLFLLLFCLLLCSSQMVGSLHTMCTKYSIPNGDAKKWNGHFSFRIYKWLVAAVYDNTTTTRANSQNITFFSDFNHFTTNRQGQYSHCVQQFMIIIWQKSRNLIFWKVTRDVSENQMQTKWLHQLHEVY